MQMPKSNAMQMPKSNAMQMPKSNAMQMQKNNAKLRICIATLQIYAMQNCEYSMQNCKYAMQNCKYAVQNCKCNFFSAVQNALHKLQMHCKFENAIKICECNEKLQMQ
jgi:hypothetical protein